MDLLETVEFKVVGRLGMPFTLRPYKIGVVDLGYIKNRNI